MPEIKATEPPVTRRPWLVLAIMCIGFFMSLLDGSIVAVSVAALGVGFRDYVSLQLTIVVEKIQLGQDGRTATVTATVTNAPARRGLC